MIKSFWGKQLLIDCYKCEYSLINDKENIKYFIKILLENISMIPIGDPQIEFLLEGSDNEGYSFVQLISTSNITGHFVNTNCSGYIDVFSCKDFDENVVSDCINDFFKPKDIKHKLIYRNIP